MTAILKVDEIQDTIGNLIIKEASNTITIGASGDTITIPSGATITNSGTATGFGGITEADQWRLTADLIGSNGDITSNLERVNETCYAKIGTGMSQSSGIFSFPSTGLYEITIEANVYTPTQDNCYVALHVTLNNSSYDEYSRAGMSSTNSYEDSATATGFVNVTDTSNVKVKFVTSSFASNSGLQGNSSINQTAFKFIRLGDSQ